MMLRNRELARTALVAAAVTLAGAIAAWWLLSPGAALAVALTSCAVGAVWLDSTLARYRALAELAAQVDRVLHGERDVAFARMREGELAILASELDKMKNRLTLAAEDLESEKNALADALADISHQLKTPLTSLTLMTVNLRRRLSADAGGAADAAQLRSMERLLGRVQWLVASLLKLARIDAGVVSFSREHVGVPELVERSFEPLAVAFDLADVAFDTTGVDPSAGFEGDVAWTSEALENILKNCLEHTPAGGCVCVSAKEDALGCRIRVTDTGPGIAEKDLPHVFERFYRGGSDGCEVDPAGVGIGLALAQSLVAAQGGSVRASNAPCGGAVFDIVFMKAVV